ncbi:MAG: sucrase ferredoxin [Actinomycetota bacterium]|nr:sucrase ferredoxin [Actinomycetota bacterium]
MADVPCASAARDRHESLHATASIVRNWVLVEQPGPWGRDAPQESRLRKDVATALQSRAQDSDFRLLLLRRPVAARPEPEVRRCFISHSRRPSPWIEELVFEDAAELTQIDFSPLAQGRPTDAGLPRHEPLYLVCTNGKHDPCCARLGRPVVRALVPELGDALWECSHVGGDRFAGNLVCLPHGFYFGGLGPTEAATVVEGYQRGVVELDWFRGTAGDPYVVQAAEYFVRRQEDLHGVDDVASAGWRKLRPGVVEVVLSGLGGRTFRATVEVNPAADARPLTCAAISAERPPTFSLLELKTD